MYKYNVAICCRPDSDTLLLDYLSDTYDVRLLSYSSINNYDCYNYIITDNDILWFLSEITDDFVVQYIKDDISYILNRDRHRKNKTTIYGNKYIKENIKYDFIFNLSRFEKDILSICRDIEHRYYSNY